MVGSVVVSRLDPRRSIREYPLKPDLPMRMGNYASLAAFIFLLVASPFFFRRLGKIAWLGWGIALSVVLYVAAS